MKKQYLKRISKLKTDKQDKLKKVGKTTRPFRYDLNHILNDYMEKAMATHFSTLAWKIPWTEKPAACRTGRLQSMGSLRVGQD